LIASTERDLAEIQGKIERQKAEVAKYSGGLVLAMAAFRLATMRQTESILSEGSGGFNGSSNH